MEAEADEPAAAADEPQLGSLTHAAAKDTASAAFKTVATRAGAVDMAKFSVVEVEGDGDCAFRAFAIVKLALLRKKKAACLPVSDAEEETWIYQDIERQREAWSMSPVDVIHAQGEALRAMDADKKEKAAKATSSALKALRSGGGPADNKRGISSRSQRAASNKRRNTGGAAALPPERGSVLPTTTTEETRTAMRTMGKQGGLWGDECVLHMGCAEMSMRILVINDSGRNISAIEPVLGNAVNPGATSLAIFKRHASHYSVLSSDCNIVWLEGDVLPEVVMASLGAARPVPSVGWTGLQK